ncbi:hypothetical protein LPJGGPFB_04908 [Ensifer adhaerens]|nr:hypothetical protein [Ensifer adhaerens]
MSLEHEGFTVFEASNADDVIQIFNARSDIRLMFTDIDMPGSIEGADPLRDGQKVSLDIGQD